MIRIFTDTIRNLISEWTFFYLLVSLENVAVFVCKSQIARGDRVLSLRAHSSSFFLTFFWNVFFLPLRNLTDIFSTWLFFFSMVVERRWRCEDLSFFISWTRGIRDWCNVHDVVILVLFFKDNVHAIDARLNSMSVRWSLTLMRKKNADDLYLSSQFHVRVERGHFVCSSLPLFLKSHLSGEYDTIFLNLFVVLESFNYSNYWNWLNYFKW